MRVASFIVWQGEADVLACVVNSQTGMVKVKDAWNPPGYLGPEIDNNQDGVCLHSANYTDGQISCLLVPLGSSECTINDQ